MYVDRVLLADPRGFCAGVEMAIKALTWMVRAFDEPVYCYHEIVHNRVVVERFETLGVVFVDDLDEVPEGAPLMLSAHGSAPEVVRRAGKLAGYRVDAVCPLVTKVHHEVRTRSEKGYQIVYVGHAGHEEAEGTMAVAPEVVHRVERADDVEALGDLGDRVALLAQTTLSHRDWAGVLDAAADRWPHLWSPERGDLCFATTNRQAALLDLVDRCDAVVVIGSRNSSNTGALVRLAEEAGCPRVEWINRADELPDDLHGTVGVTAGASAPDEVVEAVVASLAPRDGVETVRHTDEDEYFPPPRNLRDLLASIRVFAGLGFAGLGRRLRSTGGPGLPLVGPLADRRWRWLLPGHRKGRPADQVLRLVERRLDGPAQLLGQLVDQPAGHPAVDHRWDDRLADHDHHLDRTDPSSAMGHRPIGARDAHRHDRHPGPSGDEGRPGVHLGRLHHGPVLARPLGKHHHGLTTVEHLLAGSQRGPVGAPSLHRESTQQGHQPASKATVPDRFLAQEAELPGGHHSTNWRVEVRAVDGRQDEGTVGGHTFLVDDPQPE
jgi:4-hydroxy-3-methylbut-2-enyl diphosphate reductase